MSKRISLKLTDKNDWLADKLNEEKEDKIDQHSIIR